MLNVVGVREYTPDIFPLHNPDFLCLSFHIPALIQGSYQQNVEPPFFD